MAEQWRVEAAGELRRAGQRLGKQGFCAGTNGNLSVRSPQDGNLVLITVTGADLCDLHCQNLCAMRLAEGGQAGRPDQPASSEWAVHRAVYLARPDIGAVVHVHAPCATAWACSGLAVPEAIHPEAQEILGVVPVVPYATPGTQHLADLVTESMDPDTSALLLANHGPVAIGQTIAEAIHRLECLESYCQLVINLRSIGEMHRLSPDEVAEIGARRRRRESAH